MEAVDQLAELCVARKLDYGEVEACCDEGKALPLYGLLLGLCDVAYEDVLNAVRRGGYIECGPLRIKLCPSEGARP